MLTHGGSNAEASLGRRWGAGDSLALGGRRRCRRGHRGLAVAVRRPGPEEHALAGHGERRSASATSRRLAPKWVFTTAAGGTCPLRRPSTGRGCTSRTGPAICTPSTGTRARRSGEADLGRHGDPRRQGAGDPGDRGRARSSSARRARSAEAARCSRSTRPRGTLLWKHPARPQSGRDRDAVGGRVRRPGLRRRRLPRGGAGGVHPVLPVLQLPRQHAGARTLTPASSCGRR